MSEISLADTQKEFLAVFQQVKKSLLNIFITGKVSIQFVQQFSHLQLLGPVRLPDGGLPRPGGALHHQRRRQADCGQPHGPGLQVRRLTNHQSQFWLQLFCFFFSLLCLLAVHKNSWDI